ncbi:MAG: octaprenyl diphosphate synthase [Betaproteobacteria bacterium SG8_40]|nr:MAG: octaprenyl diphosphate synthase [Betaproteobacteria bacterium SG8_40]
MRAVNAVIRQRLHSDVALIRQVAEYIISSGGKRLRPALLILVAGACGYRGRAHHELAAVVEFIHTATLLHDDVVDDSSMRRGRATANAEFGNPASVLVGDFLYSRAFQMMVSVQDMRVMEVLADATNTIAEGEVLQLMSIHNIDITEDEYLRVVRSKTAKLFEAAGRLGGIVSGVSSELEEALARYGAHIGTAFQLVDDILDYSGELEHTGKNIGEDLAEGKVTLPLIFTVRHAAPGQQDLIFKAVASAAETDFEPVVAAMRECGALDYARSRAVAESRLATAALESVPNSKHRDCLLELAAFAVSRNH